MIYPSQVTRLRDFFDDFLSKYKDCRDAVGTAAQFAESQFWHLAQQAESLYESLKVEAVPVGTEEREDSSERACN